MLFEPTLNFVQCPDAAGGHRMAYWDWGSPDNSHVVVCVHGISRQGRDFDTLARRLIGENGQRCRVVSVDIAGRGHSDWLADPRMYVVPSYAADMLALLGHLRASGTVKTIDWVGTSMGGLIGIAVAAQPGAQLHKMILNDVGPVVQWEALQRISSYIGADPRFASEQEGADKMWEVSRSFGPHTKEQWLALSQPMLRPVTDGSGGAFKLHYDPAIAVPVKATTPELAAQGEAMLWQLYDTITTPTLLIRGVESDLLSPATANAMQQRGPKAQLVEFEGVGHAPTLIANNQVSASENFLFS
jgi:pimeloyl-ACP methyl ester carboxylesterase